MTIHGRFRTWLPPMRRTPEPPPGFVPFVPPASQLKQPVEPETKATLAEPPPPEHEPE